MSEYIRVLNSNSIGMIEIKNKVRKEYHLRIGKVLGSKLDGGNTVKAINSRAVALVHYIVGMINWSVDELKNIDRKNKNLMNTNKALHSKANVHRMYGSRRKKGKKFSI